MVGEVYTIDYVLLECIIMVSGYRVHEEVVESSYTPRENPDGWKLLCFGLLYIHVPMRKTHESALNLVARCTLHAGPRIEKPSVLVLKYEVS